jgi:hypothetical protein
MADLNFLSHEHYEYSEWNKATVAIIDYHDGKRLSYHVLYKLMKS